MAQYGMDFAPRCSDDSVTERMRAHGERGMLFYIPGRAIAMTRGFGLAAILQCLEYTMAAAERSLTLVENTDWSHTPGFVWLDWEGDGIVPFRRLIVVNRRVLVPSNGRRCPSSPVRHIPEAVVDPLMRFGPSTPKSNLRECTGRSVSPNGVLWLVDPMTRVLMTNWTHLTKKIIRRDWLGSVLSKRHSRQRGAWSSNATRIKRRFSPTPRGQRFERTEPRRTTTGSLGSRHATVIKTPGEMRQAVLPSWRAEPKRSALRLWPLRGINRSILLPWRSRTVFGRPSRRTVPAGHEAPMETKKIAEEPKGRNPKGGDIRPVMPKSVGMVEVDDEEVQVVLALTATGDDLPIREPVEKREATTATVKTEPGEDHRLLKRALEEVRYLCQPFGEQEPHTVKDALVRSRM